jgi:hypothetical protein
LNIISRLERLERATQASAPTHDLTLLTDAELLALEECFSKAEARGLPLDQYLTPEVYAALHRVERRT